MRRAWVPRGKAFRKEARRQHATSRADRPRIDDALVTTTMTVYVALLRAVNVGGTGKLPMAELVALCMAASFASARTYIASGNVVFASDLAEAHVRLALERRLTAHVGRRMGVMVRTAAEMADVLARNPWPAAPGNRVMALFVDGPQRRSHDRCSGGWSMLVALARAERGLRNSPRKARSCRRRFAHAN